MDQQSLIKKVLEKQYVFRGTSDLQVEEKIRFYGFYFGRTTTGSYTPSLFNEDFLTSTTSDLAIALFYASIRGKSITQDSRYRSGKPILLAINIGNNYMYVEPSTSEVELVIEGKIQPSLLTKIDTKEKFKEFYALYEDKPIEETLLLESFQKDILSK